MGERKREREKESLGHSRERLGRLRERYWGDRERLGRLRERDIRVFAKEIGAFKRGTIDREGEREREREREKGERERDLLTL